MISVPDLVRIILALCGGISALGAAAVYILKAVGWLRKPEKERMDKLADHEARISKLEVKVSNDFEEIKDLKRQNYLLLNAMLEMIKQQIDGKDTEAMKKVRDSIQQYMNSKAILGEGRDE